MPQNYIIGPLLIYIIINNMILCFPENIFTLFPDDTNLIISVIDLPILITGHLVRASSNPLD